MAADAAAQLTGPERVESPLLVIAPEPCGSGRGVWPGRGRMAEAARFELADSCPSLVFKTSALNHSATLPGTVR